MLDFKNIKIGDLLLDSESSLTEMVLDKTTNSINITQTKRTDKGINCTQWFFNDGKFQERFKKI